MGMVLINMQESGIYKTYSRELEDIADYIVILNENSQIISCNDKRMLGQTFQQSFGINENFSLKSDYFISKINNVEHIYIYIYLVIVMIGNM